MMNNCVCGFNPPIDPNPECERCQLVAEVERLQLYISQIEHDGNQLRIKVERLTTGCPGCGGPTEYSRELPPSPYYCDGCSGDRQQ